MIRIKHSLSALAMLALVSTSMFMHGQMKSGPSPLSCSIRGQVRYEDGRFADHIVVRLRSDVVSFQTEQTTDPQGKFDFGGLGPTRYRLTIEGQGVRPYENYIDVSMSHMAYEQITLKLAREPNANKIPQKVRTQP